MGKRGDPLSTWIVASSSERHPPSSQIFPAASGKEPEIREASTDLGDPSLLMPSLPATSRELAQLCRTSRRVYPAICTACKEAKVPNFSQGLVRDLLCLGWETEQDWSSSPHLPAWLSLHGPACSSGACLGDLG